MNCLLNPSMADESGTDDPHEEIERPSAILRYDRAELLRLQEESGHLQDEWCTKHVKDLGPDVVQELHELQAVPDTSHLRRRSKNSERRLRSKAKREALHAISMNALGSDKGVHEEYDNSLDGSLDTSLRRVYQNAGERRHAGKPPRNYESFYADDIPEPESFQPQAFAVEGEPNFESGPPEDGWEYLRRVKYEAARCPKVVVAQIDLTKLVSEQTPYMPEIPEIPACPSYLLPSKEWENYFLGDFSLLRMALSNTRVPPKFPADRIPPLRNKTAWEVRCFGSVTSVEDEESREVDSVTTKEQVTEPEDEEREHQAKNPSLPSVDSAKNESACAANDSRSEILDDEKELLEPLIEFVETHVDPLVNAESLESSYVIDLGLIADYIPNYYKPEEPFNESEYFISGEPAEADDAGGVQKAAYSFTGISDAVNGPVQSPESLDSQISNLMELGHVDGSCTGIIPHFEQLIIGGPEEEHVDKEDTNSLSYHPVPVCTESDHPIIADLEGSIGAHANTIVHPEVESFPTIERQANHLSTRDFGDAENGIQLTQSPGNLKIDECEDELLETADFTDSYYGNTWTLDEAEFGEFYGGIDSQLDSLAIGDPGEMELKLSSFSDTDEFQEVGDVHLPTPDFVDSLIGLEIYRGGNVLADEAEEGLDPSDQSSEFKIDGSLEELFIKVFQQVGVAQLPFVHLLLRLDEVSRAALFRHHVSWLENVNGLPKDRALWLLALSAVIDTPLDSQTSAAFRTMLRHCAAVRALKQTRDDEDLYLLNVLITVAGVYFGQAEAGLP